MSNISILTYRKPSDVKIDGKSGKRLYIRGCEIVERWENINGTECCVCKPHSVSYKGADIAYIRVNRVLNRSTGKVIRGMYNVTIFCKMSANWYLDGRDGEWKPLPSYDKDPKAYSDALANAVETEDDERETVYRREYIDATAYKELRELVRHSKSEKHLDYSFYESWLEDIFG